jgi:hypothetical protein
MTIALPVVTVFDAIRAPGLAWLPAVWRKKPTWMAGVNYLGRPATTILAGRMRGGWHLRRGRGVFGLGLL